jgi:hypothetical protein
MITRERARHGVPGPLAPPPTPSETIAARSRSNAVMTVFGQLRLALRTLARTPLFALTAMTIVAINNDDSRHKQGAP